MKLTFLAAPSLVGLCLATAHAQTSSAGQANMSSQNATMTASQSQPGSLSAKDKKFLRHTAQGADYELTIGKLAEKKAAKPDVRQYAQTIVSDHEKLNASLDRIAQKNEVNLPSHLRREQEQKVDHLKTLNGAAFDRAYLAQMKRVNSQDKSEIQKEINTTTNSQVKAFTRQMQTADAKHLQMAERLQGQG